MATPALTARVAGRDWTYQYGRDPEHLTPTDKQAFAHRTFAKERLYGGGAGGGKTDWLLAEVIRTCLTWGVHGLVLRRLFGDFNQPEGIIPRLLERIPRWVARYNKNEKQWTFPNGATLKLGYFRTDADVQQYMGAEIGVVAWDQLEQFTEWMYRRMFHPLRGQPPTDVAARNLAAGFGVFEPFMAASANPGGVGHTWVKGRFIDPAPPGVLWQPTPTEEERKPGTRIFIPALVDDNPFVTPEYSDQLENMPPDEREALRYGNWDVYAGARFSHWRRDVHVIDPEDFPIAEGEGVPRGLGIDYGSEAPFAALWGALFPDGLIVVYRELYQAGLSPEEQAKLIRSVEIPAGERVGGRALPTWLDPSCWARNPNEPKAPVQAISGGGKGAPLGSIADTYRRNGVNVAPANNDRRSGTARIASKLKVRADHRPRLYVYSNCLNLIRTLPGIPRDKIDPELYDTKAEDHAVDALRYLLMGLDPGGDAARARPGDRLTGGPTIDTDTGGLRW